MRTIYEAIISSGDKERSKKMYQYKRVDVFHHKDVDKISGVAVSIIIATMMAIWGVAWVDTGNFWGIFVWLGKAFVWITYCFFYGIFTAFF